MSVACRLCGQTLTKPFSLADMPASAQGFETTEDAAVTGSVEMNLYQCGGCGLVQYDGPLVPYYRDVIRSSKLSEPMMNFRRSQFQSVVEAVDSTASSVFELGCGDGEYLDIFAELGLQTAGIEGSKTLSQGGRAKGHDVTTGFLTETAMPPEMVERFDIVSSFNFIEHLPDPLASLRELAGFLRPGGVALLEVPNYDMISEFHLFNEFIPDHRFYFTQETFTALLSQAGFQVIECNAIWDSYIISVVARKRPAADWAPFESARQRMKDEIVSFFAGSDREQNAVWSAGHQSLATLSNLNIDSIVTCIIDSAPAKQGKFAPASGLPIMSPQHLEEGSIRRVLLAAAGFNAEIADFIRRSHGDAIEIGYLNKGRVEHER